MRREGYLRRSYEELVKLPRGADVEEGPRVVICLDASPVATILQSQAGREGGQRLI